MKNILIASFSTISHMSGVEVDSLRERAAVRSAHQNAQCGPLTRKLIDSTVLRCRTKERIWGMRILEGLYSVEDKKRTVGLRNRQISIFQPSRPNIVCEFQSVSNQYLLYTLHSRLVPKALIEDKARFYTSDFVISRN